MRNNEMCVYVNADRLDRRGYGGKGPNSHKILHFVLCILREAFEELLEKN